MTLHLPSWLDLKKQRYRCKACARTYLSASNLTEPGCCLSNPLKHDLIRQAKTKVSVTDIAREHKVSWMSVHREISRWAELFERDIQSLPKVLCLDKLRAVSTLSNARMALSVVDGQRHKTLDICPDRKLGFLLRHFGQYPQSVRDGVEYICMDMYDPYLCLAKKLFPKAKVCIDKFHVVQATAQAVNACRVEVMKGLLDRGAYKTFKCF